MTAPRKPASNTDSRLSTVEEGLRSQNHQIIALRKDFQEFARDVRNGLAERSRFPWAAIAVIVSILGGLITLGAWGPLREQERQERQIEALDTRADRVAATRFSSDDANGMEADFSNALSRAEARAERFVALMVAPITVKLDDVRAEMDRLRDKVEDHQADGHPARVEAIARGVEGVVKSNAERIRALESKISD